MIQAQVVELLSRCDGPPFKLESCRKLTTLWAGYGAIYELKVQQQQGKQTQNLIIKDVVPRTDSGVSHERKLRSYQVEAAFYQKVAPELLESGLAIATPLLAESNLTNSGGSMHLVLTDLRDAFPIAGNRSMDLPHSKAALSFLAHLHASHWQQPIPIELWENGTFLELSTRQEELAAIEPEWRDLQRAAQMISDELAHSKFATLVHGDFKGANILFSSTTNKGGELTAAAYDFQYCGGGDGMKDVAYLLVSTVQGKVLDLHENELLRHYHDQLTRRLPQAAAAEYTFEIMQQRFHLAVCDLSRFMSGWGWWGNTNWAASRCRQVLKTIQ